MRENLIDKMKEEQLQFNIVMNQLHLTMHEDAKRLYNGLTEFYKRQDEERKLPYNISNRN